MKAILMLLSCYLRSKLFLLGELASSSDSKPLGWQSCPRLLTHCRTCDASVLMFSRPTRFFWWPLLPGSHDLGIGDSRRNELTLLKKCREPFSQSSRTCLLLRWCYFSLSFLGSRGSFHHLQSVQPKKVQVCRNLILMVPEKFPAEHSFSTFVQVERQNLTEVRSNFNLEFVFVLGT